MCKIVKKINFDKISISEKIRCIDEEEISLNEIKYKINKQISTKNTNIHNKDCLR
jgi:hypothetical protein